MEILRTPEDRFDKLADWPYAPHYLHISDQASGQSLRMAYVDEGPRDGRTVLLLHGEPSWSYLYRHMIASLAAAGHRVIAPDLIGFGRSDKPAEKAQYTYERSVAWLSSWLIAMDLQQVTLCCQDWGGLLGLRLVAAFPERFSGVVAANTALPAGEPLSAAFMQWQAFSQSDDDLPVGQLIAMACDRQLSPAEIAAYDAPFPDARYKAAVIHFPTLVPTMPQHASVTENRAAWSALAQFNKPFVTAFSDNDAVTRGMDLPMQTRIPGARGQPHCILKGAHFLQEDSPDALVAVIDALVARGSRSAADSP